MTEKKSTLPYSFAKRHGVIIDQQTPTETIIAYKNSLTPQSLLQTVIEIKRRLQTPITLQPLSDEAFSTRLTHAYESDAAATKAMAADMEDDLDLNQLMDQMPKTEDLLESQDDAPIIRLLNAILSQAIKQQASDIHIETFEERVTIRYRIDGILHEVLELNRVLAPLLISRIKVMAKLDIAEKRVPQDGRMTLRIAGHTIDVRVSTIPASHGERIVLRLLDKKVARLDLEILGMNSKSLEQVRALIKKPHGILLITGPTGSGKTTSLYAMLTELNEVSRNILTVEDPIEFDLSGIGQTQVNPKVKMTFARGLRAILRQDPDVVMVGEIRDIETAEIAVQASLTGHLVLSTLHTNSAVGAVTRLQDMGVEPFLLSSSLIGVIAQRLIRLLCPDCKTPYLLSTQDQKRLHLTADQLSKIEKIEKNKTISQTIYKANGCEKCNQRGYIGRAGIYEIIPIDHKLQAMIHEGVSEKKLEEYARKHTQSIHQDGFNKMLQGLTSLEEVLRVTTAHEE